MQRKLKIVPFDFPNAREIVKIAKKKNETNLDNNYWWYFDGRLERLLGFDKGVIINMSEFPQYQGDTLFSTEIVGNEARVDRFIHIKEIKFTGIAEVEVLGVSEKCIGYFWVTNEITIYAVDRDKNKTSFQNWRQRGIICLESDMEAREKAMKSFNKGEELI